MVSPTNYMAVATMGGRLIRSQTLGISVGNPLSLEPDLNVWNDQAFNTIDWAVYQAREHGIRIMAPLIDNYVSTVFLVLVKDSQGEGLLPWGKVCLFALARHQHIDCGWLFDG